MRSKSKLKMKNIQSIILVFALFLLAEASFAQGNNVGVGTTTPDPSAILDVASNTKGLLIPSMNSLQRLGIIGPKDGLLVYDTDFYQFWYWNDDLGTWLQASGAQPGMWRGLCIYNSANHGNVGSPCDHQMIAPVLGIQQCTPGWTWINLSASNQQSGTGLTTEWTGTCVKN